MVGGCLSLVVGGGLGEGRLCSANSICFFFCPLASGPRRYGESGEEEAGLFPSVAAGCLRCRSVCERESGGRAELWRGERKRGRDKGWGRARAEVKYSRSSYVLRACGNKMEVAEGRSNWSGLVAFVRQPDVCCCHQEQQQLQTAGTYPAGDIYGKCGLSSGLAGTSGSSRLVCEWWLRGRGVCHSLPRSLTHTGNPSSVSNRPLQATHHHHHPPGLAGQGRQHPHTCPSTKRPFQMHPSPACSTCHRSSPDTFPFVPPPFPFLLSLSSLSRAASRLPTQPACPALHRRPIRRVGWMGWDAAAHAPPLRERAGLSILFGTCSLFTPRLSAVVAAAIGS